MKAEKFRELVRKHATAIAYNARALQFGPLHSVQIETSEGQGLDCAITLLNDALAQLDVAVSESEGKEHV